MTAGRRASGRDFFIDTLIVAITQVALKIRGIVTLPLIVKLLGTVMYGVWSQTTSFTSFLGGLLGLNLHLPLVRFAAADRARARVIYSTLLLSTFLITSAGGLIVVLLSRPIGRVLIDEVDLSPYLQLGVIAMVLSNVRILNINLYRATGHLLARSVFELIASFGELAGIIVLLAGGYTLLHVMVFIAAWQGVLMIAQSVHASRVIGGFARPDGAIFREALRYALPLLPAALSVWALDRIDRFVIGWHEGARGVGIYSANYAFAGLLMLFQAPFQITLLPKVAALWDVDRERAAYFVAISNKIFLTFAIPFVLAMPFIAEPVLVLLANEDIADGSLVTTFLIAAGIMFWGAAIMQTQIFHGARRPGVVGAVTLATAAVNLILNLILVPTMGVPGAALATLVAYGLTAVLLWWLGSKVVAVELDVPHLVKCALAGGVAALVLHAISPRAGWSLAVGVVAAAAAYATALWLLGFVIRGRIEVDVRKLVHSLRRPS